jgi:hypothetical protein
MFPNGGFDHVDNVQEINRNDTVLDMRSIDPKYTKKMADDSKMHHLLEDDMFQPRKKVGWLFIYQTQFFMLMWRPSSSSISRARFLTTGAIHQKLCTYVPLGKSNSQTKFRSNLSLGLATRGNQKHKSPITLELMARSSPNFDHRDI